MSNPYEAPSAELSNDASRASSELRNAVDGFVWTGWFVRTTAIVALALAVALGAGAIGIATTLLPSLHRPIATRGQLVGNLVVAALAALILAGIFWRLSRPMFALASKPTWQNVRRMLRRLSELWFLYTLSGIIHIGDDLTTLASISFGMAAIVPAAADDVVGDARTLRRVMRAAFVVQAASVATGFMRGEAKPILIVAVGLQALMTWLIWRHVPALDTFIAAPSAATLTGVARAHRSLWRTSVLITLFAMLAISLFLVSLMAMKTMRGR